MIRTFLRLLVVLGLCGTFIHADTSTAPTTRRPVDEVLNGVKAPAGFRMTLFAQPPDVNYPACIAVTPRGELFAGIDEQGSLGREPGRGRIVRCTDTDNDGVADQFTPFARLDHPRGMVWDEATRSLYVMHPPNLSRYVDEDRDGVAERSVVLVQDLFNALTQGERGADHTTNGIQLGIDGWIYVAVGDFGAYRATGADGTRLTMRGGGIVRVRPDGSRLETYATGTRNIYDVAIDPLMNIFTRDNTNDGGGWNDRLTYSPPSAYHGYPSRYKRFGDEIVDCMIDFGGGSPCGSLFVDEPGLPKGLNKTLYTVEWGQNRIDHHPLTASGAGFTATTEKLLDLPRGTDIVVDGASNLYISSWAGGGFNYTDAHVGYVVRLSPKGYEAPAFPDLRSASESDLLSHLRSPSGVLRQGAQREILHRGEQPALVEGLVKLAQTDGPLVSRVIALFTLKQLCGPAADKQLLELVKHEDLRELALRALADDPGSDVPTAPFVQGLRDPNPRVRLIAAWALARLNRAEAASEILPLTADTDPLVSHVAITSLARLKAVEPCLAAVSTSDPKTAWGALQALRQVHEERVITGLASRLDEVTAPTLRAQIYRALCRLHMREADWDGTGWWSTRPDTSGPYYQPVAWSGTPRVVELLRKALAGGEPPQVVHSLLVDAAAHKIDLPEVQDTLLRLVLTDSALAGAFVDTLAGRKELGEREMKAMRDIVTSDTIEPAVRGKAIRMLGEELNDAASVTAAVEALGRIAVTEEPHPALSAALESYIVNPDQFRQIKVLSQLASKGPAGQREVALATLIHVAGSNLAKPDPRKRAKKFIASAWNEPAMVTPLLRAVGRTKAGAYAAEVRVRLASDDPAIARAAAHAAARLGEALEPQQTVAELGYDQALATAAKLDGDAARGRELFTSQGCVACHTVSPEEPPKGPFLGGIATRYSRGELLESILKPSARIAQGFDTQWFKTGGDVLEGFVTRESGEEIELRNLTGAATLLKKTDVTGRGKRDTSMMPTNLVDPLSPRDLASLVAYLESLKPH